MKKSPKLIILVLVLALSLPLATTQAQVFDQGDVVLSFGFGLGAYNYNLSNGKTTFPHVFITGDYCLREDLGPGNLGVGAYLGYQGFKYDWAGYGWKEKNLVIAARGTYHFTDLVDKLDLYGGVSLGGEIVTVDYYGSYAGYEGSSNSSGPLFELFAGARYFFTDSFAGMAELGGGITWFKIGLSLKL